MKAVLGALRSRKFLTAVLTAVGAILKPELQGAIVTIGTVLIGAIALEDAAQKHHGGGNAPPPPAPPAGGQT